MCDLHRQPLFVRIRELLRKPTVVVVAVSSNRRACCRYDGRLLSTFVREPRWTMDEAEQSLSFMRRRQAALRSTSRTGGGRGYCLGPGLSPSPTPGFRPSWQPRNRDPADRGRTGHGTRTKSCGDSAVSLRRGHMRRHPEVLRPARRGRPKTARSLTPMTGIPRRWCAKRTRDGPPGITVESPNTEVISVSSRRCRPGTCGSTTGRGTWMSHFFLYILGLIAVAVVSGAAVYGWTRKSRSRRGYARRAMRAPCCAPSSTISPTSSM